MSGRYAPFAFAVSLVMAGPAAAEGGLLTTPGACSAAIDKKIADLSIARGDIDRIAISPRYSNQDDETNRLLGIDAWVYLKSCAGALVIDMERDCSLRQVYTRGRCTLPGIKAY